MPEAVHQLLFHFVHLGDLGAARQLLVQGHALEAVLDVFLGHEGVLGELDFRVEGRQDLGPLHLLHGLAQHAVVGLEAHRRDVPALLQPQDVAGPADLQVAHGDLEAAAQVGELLQGIQALLGLVA